jgi:hypothetical protein
MTRDLLRRQQLRLDIQAELPRQGLRDLAPVAREEPHVAHAERAQRGQGGRHLGESEASGC